MIPGCKSEAQTLSVRCAPESALLLRERGWPVPPTKLSVRILSTHMCAQGKGLCSLSGEIDDLAYISTSEYRFDGQDKSVVCTVSSDGTVRAWDL